MPQDRAIDRRRALTLLGAGLACLGLGGLGLPGLAAAGSSLDAGLDAQRLMAIGRLDQALGVLERLAPGSGDPWLLGMLGRARLMAGDAAGAAAAFADILVLDPSNAQARDLLALAESRRGGRRLRVVLDPGHGGHDPGALGLAGLREKDVVLDIALAAARVLRDEAPDVDVVLTRGDDTFLPLTARSAMASGRRADLFVSLHANAHEKPSANGLETYFCSPKASSAHAARVAARENAQPQGAVAPALDLEAVITRFTMARQHRAGRQAAGALQERLASGLDFRDRGVQSANFHVLRASRCPSVLLETGFVTNEAEARVLARPEGRARVARQVALAVRDAVRAGEGGRA